MSPKTEKKICKQVGINMSVVSPASLMLCGKLRKKRMFFRSTEYFSINVDGLAAFEANVVLFHPLPRAIFHLKNVLTLGMFKDENQSSFVAMGLSAIKLIGLSKRRKMNGSE